MQAEVIAICSNPECNRHAGARVLIEIPDTCPACGSPMLTQCWKCETPLTDPFMTYCAHCGVPLKRVLPRTERGRRFLAICGNPECDWAVEVQQASALPSRCPRCRTVLVSHCWKCGSGIVDLHQHYCQVCGVPLKRQLRPV